MSAKTMIVAGVAIAFALILGLKLGGVMNGRGTAVDTSAVSAQGQRISEQRADAVRAYDDAVEDGMPVYVLFHSLTCESCKDISAVVDEVLPAYEGRIVFVNAITDDASAQRLASRFQFQYIPTSFFVDSQGRIVESHTGVLTRDEMTAKLDALVGK